MGLHWGKAQFLPNGLRPAPRREKHGKPVNRRAVNYYGFATGQILRGCREAIFPGVRRLEPDELDVGQAGYQERLCGFCHVILAKRRRQKKCGLTFDNQHRCPA